MYVKRAVKPTSGESLVPPQLLVVYALLPNVFYKIKMRGFWEATQLDNEEKRGLGA